MPLDGNEVDAIYADKANAAAVADKVDLTIVADKVKEANKASVSIELPMLLPFLSICRSLFDNGIAIVLYLPLCENYCEARLGIPIFGSNFWDPHCKQNSDSVFDSEDSGRIFFEIPMSGESENRNSDSKIRNFGTS